MHVRIYFVICNNSTLTCVKKKVSLSCIEISAKQISFIDADKKTFLIYDCKNADV